VTPHVAPALPWVSRVCSTRTSGLNRQELHAHAHALGRVTRRARTVGSCLDHLGAAPPSVSSLPSCVYHLRVHSSCGSPEEGGVQAPSPHAHTRSATGTRGMPGTGRSGAPAAPSAPSGCIACADGSSPQRPQHPLRRRQTTRDNVRTSSEFRHNFVRVSPSLFPRSSVHLGWYTLDRRHMYCRGMSPPHTAKKCVASSKVMMHYSS